MSNRKGFNAGRKTFNSGISMTKEEKELVNKIRLTLMQQTGEHWTFTETDRLLRNYTIDQIDKNGFDILQLPQAAA